jgi:hypothetical protein
MRGYVKNNVFAKKICDLRHLKERITGVQVKCFVTPEPKITPF